MEIEEFTVRGYRGILSGEGTVLRLACGGSYTTAFVKTCRTVRLKNINFTVCKLYLKMGSKRSFVRGFCFHENVCSHLCLMSANLYPKKI